jgi:hypothetical protein
VRSGQNDITTTHHELSKHAYGWHPHEFTKTSTRAFDWKCELGHVFRQRINKQVELFDRKTPGAFYCPYCHNELAFPKFNDLKTTHPRLAEQAFDWDPTTVMKRSIRKRKWICENRHIWIASPSSRRNANCPKCNRQGYRPHKEGWLYLVEHPVWEMLQIGISNKPEQRLDVHKKSGWRVLDMIGPFPGDETYRLEQNILRALESRGVRLGQHEIAGKFSGYTEAWSIDDFTTHSLNELVGLIDMR